MSEHFYTLITEAGQKKLATMLSDGASVQLSHVAVGDGAGGNYQPVSSQTALKRECYRAEITRLIQNDANTGWLMVEVIVPEAVGGFFIREIGLFDRENTLFAIGKFPETYKPASGTGSQRQLLVRMVVAVMNDQAATILIDGSNIISPEETVKRAIAGLDWKTTVRVATIGPAELTGLYDVDGVTLASGDKILVKNQSDKSENGIYVVSENSWHRSEDMVGKLPFYGVMVTVSEGIGQAESLWFLALTEEMNIGQDELIFSLLSCQANSQAIKKINHNKLAFQYYMSGR